ncbi:MAG: hypothetical protein JWN78_921 [Bacteroidota bacterium]|nr:hypothetical protein [Bacteroidota bacterium]
MKASISKPVFLFVGIIFLFSFFTFNVHAESLSLEGISLKGCIEENNDALSWTVSSADEIEYFIIRRSEDAVLFEDIASIKPMECNDKKTRDNFVYTNSHDNSVENVYYKVQVVLRNKRLLESAVIRVRTLTVPPDLLIIGISNNYNQVTLKFESPKDGVINLNIVDINGAVIQSETINALEGANSFDLTLRQITNGLLIFNINDLKGQCIKKYMFSSMQ